jgi:hypothetical protein
MFLWIDAGDGPPSTSPSGSVESANLEEGEAHPIEFDTALPVEHNVSILVASDKKKCMKRCVTWLITYSVQILSLF